MVDFGGLVRSEKSAGAEAWRGCRGEAKVGRQSEGEEDGQAIILVGDSWRFGK